MSRELLLYHVFIIDISFEIYYNYFTINFQPEVNCGSEEFSLRDEVPGLGILGLTPKLTSLLPSLITQTICSLVDLLTQPRSP